MVLEDGHLDRVIFFDLDNTLISSDASTEIAFISTCNALCSEHNIDVIDFCNSVRDYARYLWRNSPA